MQPQQHVCDGVLLGKVKIPSFKDNCLRTIHLKTGYMAKGPKEIPNTATVSLTEREVAPGFQNSSLITKQEHSTLFSRHI